MEFDIDARGLTCPKPVIKTKEALAEREDPFVILVDNEAARDNVSRFARSSGCEVEVSGHPDGFLIRHFPVCLPDTGIIPHSRPILTTSSLIPSPISRRPPTGSFGSLAIRSWETVEQGFSSSWASRIFITSAMPRGGGYDRASRRTGRQRPTPRRSGRRFFGNGSSPWLLSSPA